MGVADAQFVLGRAQSLIRKVSPSVPFPEGVSNPKMRAGCSYLSAEAGYQQQGHFWFFFLGDGIEYPFTAQTRAWQEEGGCKSKVLPEK